MINFLSEFSDIPWDNLFIPTILMVLTWSHFSKETNFKRSDTLLIFNAICGLACISFYFPTTSIILMSVLFIYAVKVGFWASFQGIRLFEIDKISTSFIIFYLLCPVLPVLPLLKYVFNVGFWFL